MNAFFELKRGGVGTNFHLSYHSTLQKAVDEAYDVSGGRTEGKWRQTHLNGRRHIADTSIGAFIIVQHEFKS